MPEQVNGWLTNSGGAAAGLAALLHGGFLGGVTLLVVVLAIAIKTAGPELRQWVTLVWARQDAQKAEPAQGPAARTGDSNT